ncbi:uncharacterized protein FTOL_12627 [Fusarium torulosum]|uniref:Uncharacterized protein n=1 Tax=Fusarium torulosum TaxID=33205 RepID=A0AAE8MME9_9HYPO|nr:uncharacterized protein FTOL_12627 [Fusarium torulosum]
MYVWLGADTPYCIT